MTLLSMGLNKEEFQILYAIGRGMNDFLTIPQAIDFELTIDKIKQVLEKLSALGFITLSKQIDEHYRREYWTASITENAKREFSSKREYNVWVPRMFR